MCGMMVMLVSEWRGCTFFLYMVALGSSWFDWI